MRRAATGAERITSVDGKARIQQQLFDARRPVQRYVPIEPFFHVHASVSPPRAFAFSSQESQPVAQAQEVWRREYQYSVRHKRVTYAREGAKKDRMVEVLRNLGEEHDIKRPAMTECAGYGKVGQLKTDAEPLY